VQRARLHRRHSFYQDCKTLILVGTVAAMNVDQVHRFKRFFWSRCLFDFHRTDESSARAFRSTDTPLCLFFFDLFFFSFSLSLSAIDVLWWQNRAVKSRHKSTCLAKGSSQLGRETEAIPFFATTTRVPFCAAEYAAGHHSSARGRVARRNTRKARATRLPPAESITCLGNVNRTTTTTTTKEDAPHGYIPEHGMPPHKGASGWRPNAGSSVVDVRHVHLLVDGRPSRMDGSGPHDGAR
jgi:hypothetical protein